MPDERGTDRTQKDMRQSLVEAALALIDEAGGCRGVTLRAIAARAGCAHTNAYNYFPSLESLFWAAIIEAQRRSMETIGRHLAQATPGSSEVVRALVSAQFEFARTHPGWYRLLWFEPVSLQAPPGMLPALARPREGVTEMIRPLLRADLSDDQVRRITDLVHTYLHGELCKFVAGRNLDGREPGVPHEVEENALLLLKLLGEHAAPKGDEEKR